MDRAMVLDMYSWSSIGEILSGHISTRNDSVDQSNVSGAHQGRYSARIIHKVGGVT
jgi:hypothetical protein